MSNSIHPLTFIVGMSRGGTTWMSNSLSKHPDIAVFGESQYWGKSFVNPDKNGYYEKGQIQEIIERLSQKGILGNDVGKLNYINKTNIRELLDFAITQLPVHPTPGDLFLKIIIAISVFEKKNLVIEKTPHHVNFIDLIRTYFPDSRFIVMHRQPYEFMLSYKYQTNRLKLNTLQKLSTRLRYHPIGCALVWRSYYRSIQNVKNKLPISSYCEVMFADLKKSPEKTLIKVQTFLNVDILPDLSLKIKNKNSSFQSEEIPQLKCDDIFWMNFICKEAIAESGIKKMKCSNVMTIFLSFLKIPFWAIYALFYLLKNVKRNVFLYIKQIIC